MIKNTLLNLNINIFFIINYKLKHNNKFYYSVDQYIFIKQYTSWTSSYTSHKYCSFIVSFNTF